MTNLLTVEGLTIAYQDEPVLADVGLALAEGEILGIVGESGSGKSTLALAVLGLLPPEARTIAGTVTVHGERAVAYVPQEPMTALNPTLTIGRQIDIALAKRFARRSRAERSETAVSALSRMRLDHPKRILAAYPFELSGGQLQRCLLAMALALEPRLILADEPTTALDVTVQAEILDLLDVLAAETGAGVLFISHSIAVVWRLCPRVVVLRRGRVVEAGVTRDVIAAPQHPYTRALIDALPGRWPARTPIPIAAGEGA